MIIGSSPDAVQSVLDGSKHVHADVKSALAKSKKPLVADYALFVQAWGAVAV